MTTVRVEDSNDLHPSDGVLLAVHDGERDAGRAGELEAARQHAERCEVCRARLADLEAQSAHVRAVLASIPVSSTGTAERRRQIIAVSSKRVVPLWRRPALRAAAAVIVLAGVGAAAARPIRTWVRRRSEHVATPPAPPPARTSAIAPVDRSGATVSFAPSGPEFTVRFDVVPASGEVALDSTAAQEISARVVSGASTGGDALEVLPGELRVRNISSARASYTVTMPASVRRVRVVIAGLVVFDGTPRGVIPLVSRH